MSFAEKIPGVIKFLNSETEKSPRNILIISRRGRIRSCLFAVCYMLLKKDMSLAEAMSIAQQKRPPMKVNRYTIDFALLLIMYVQSTTMQIPDKFSAGMVDLEDALQKRYLEIRRMTQYEFLTTQVTPLFL